MTVSHIAHMVQLHHYDNLGTARFVTFSCYDRLPALSRPGAMEILAEQIDGARQAYGFSLLGYVFMPEHVHLVLLPPDGMMLGRVIGEIKSRSARSYFADSGIGPPGATRVFWQRRCYDHNCRTPDAVREKIVYCHNNPVKRGLVIDPAGWKWSSYRAYHEGIDVPLSVDVIPL